MILEEILKLIDNHNSKPSPFRIVDIQLGTEPMALLKKELKELGIKQNIVEIDEIRGIPIKKHDSFDGFVYSLSLTYAKKAFDNFSENINTPQY